MTENYQKKIGPVVSVLIPTFNRPQYLSEALTSVLQQSYTNLQVIVVNDGGEDVRDTINSFNDSRLLYIYGKENLGKAFCLNQALSRTEGKYIAYLDDDDLYYPNHIETLVDVLENHTDCQVAYSDLYKVCCRVMPDGSRQILSKVVEVSRDFDRFLMLYFNHVLHVSLIHHRNLFEKTGPYNEELNVLIDWDITRRLAFFSDFHHVYEITGEYYNPVDECDRISVQRRKDRNEYLSNVLTIRTTRPPKPWPKIKDLSIIFITEQPDEQAKQTINSIRQYTFYPHQIYLPLSQTDFEHLGIDMTNIIGIPVDSIAPQAQRIDTALAQCDGEYIAIVPNGFPVRKFWLEDSLYALINSSSNREGLELEGSTDKLWAMVIKKDDFKSARREFSRLAIRQSLKAAGILTRRVLAEEIPFQFDQLLEQTRLTEKNGRWMVAARMLEYITENYQNRLWMKTLAARAFFNAGNLDRAEQLCCEVNYQRPVVDTLLLEAKIKRTKKDFDSAVKLLEQAEQIIERKELLWI